MKIREEDYLHVSKVHRVMCSNCTFSVYKITEIIVVETSIFKHIIFSYKPKGLINQKFQNLVPLHQKMQTLKNKSRDYVLSSKEDTERAN